MPMETNLPAPFIEVLRKARLEKSQPDSNVAHKKISWIEVLRQTKAQATAQCADPWRLRLERVRGKTGYDGVERISTQDLLDILEVPQRARSAGVCRRLATLMKELGWTPMKARGLSQSGYREVRGYARDKSN
jgi:hypothetical protein